MPDRLIDAVGAICAEAGRIALDQCSVDLHRWEKEPGHPVCAVDLEVDAFLRARLGALLPDAGWLSEETADSPARLDRRQVWVVDPIDGTRDYLRGRPGWCISVALVENGTPTIGVLDAPAHGQQWRAAAGHGATLDGRPLRTSDRAELAGARVPADTLPRKEADLVAVPRPNSIALRIAMVASGEADLLATLRWGHEWDIAAAVLIAEEAGATVSDALGAVLSFNSPSAEQFGVLAAAPGIHAAAVDRLAARARTASAR